MKKLLFSFLLVLSFGVAKSDIAKEPGLFSAQRTFTFTELNHLTNYEVPFKFFAQKKIVYGPGPKAISFQNKLMIEQKRSEIISYECAFENLRHQH